MKPFQKKTLHEEIAAYLRDMIMDGKLRVGEKIKEDQLCEALGISKTPLRESLRVLSGEGLIELVPNKGAYVTRPTFTQIREMFEVMTLLEAYCAKKAVENMKKRDLSILKRLHERLEDAYRRQDQREYIKINNRYHSEVQRIAGNETLNSLLNGLRQKILLYRFQSLNLPGRFDESIEEHRRLLDAFKDRDSYKAETIMRLHLQNQLYALERLQDQFTSAQEGR